MRRAAPRRSPPSRCRPRRPPSPAWPAVPRRVYRRSFDPLIGFSASSLCGSRRQGKHRMSRRLKPSHRLEGAQAGAADPLVHAALSASAGTGKTHVLTSRVLRLLLRGTLPSSILCLTFTKAGAAEMANRIGERLAHWVRLPDAELGLELK